VPLELVNVLSKSKMNVNSNSNHKMQTAKGTEKDEKMDSKDGSGGKMLLIRTWNFSTNFTGGGLGYPPMAQPARPNSKYFRSTQSRSYLASLDHNSWKNSSGDITGLPMQACAKQEPRETSLLEIKSGDSIGKFKCGASDSIQESYSAKISTTKSTAKSPDPTHQDVSNSQQKESNKKIPQKFTVITSPDNSQSLKSLNKNISPAETTDVDPAKSNKNLNQNPENSIP
jgi:hypothetical protein